jgi:hypothetical protein
VGAGIISSSGDEEPAPETSGQAAIPPPRTADRLVARRAGISIEKPRGWMGRHTRRTVRLRSSDGTTLVVVSAPPGARLSRRLLRTAVAVFRRRYENVRVGGTASRRLGGYPALGRLLSARNRRGVHLQTMLAAVQGRRRAWLVQVFTAEGSPPSQVLESQVALRSLRLSG